MNLIELSNYEVYSISQVEQVEIEGGNPLLLAMLGSWASTVLYETVNDWKNNVAAFQKGYNSVRK